MESKVGEDNQEHQSKWDELATGPQPESYGDENDIPNVEAVRKIAKSYFEKRRAAAPEEAKREATTIVGIENDFAKQLQRDKERGRETSEEEFVKWEQEYAQTWNRLQRDVHEGQMSMHAEAEAERQMFVSESRIDNGIIAHSGKYFLKRSEELRDVIKASHDKTKESDLRLIGTFLQTVMAHIKYRYMTPMEIRDEFGDDAADLHAYDQLRTASHNSIIKQLNSLNALADIYGTTRFTPRDFWTSENVKQTSPISERMSYDRKLVTAYYTAAFGEEIEEQRRRNSHKLSWY
jgi:hypothetical protein